MSATEPTNRGAEMEIYGRFDLAQYQQGSPPIDIVGPSTTKKSVSLRVRERLQRQANLAEVDNILDTAHEFITPTFSVISVDSRSLGSRRPAVESIPMIFEIEIDATDASNTGNGDNNNTFDDDDDDDDDDDFVLVDKSPAAAMDIANEFLMLVGRQPRHIRMRKKVAGFIVATRTFETMEHCVVLLRLFKYWDPNTSPDERKDLSHSIAIPYNTMAVLKTASYNRSGVLDDITSAFQFLRFMGVSTRLCRRLATGLKTHADRYETCESTISTRSLYFRALALAGCLLGVYSFFHYDCLDASSREAFEHLVLLRMNKLARESSYILLAEDSADLFCDYDDPRPGFDFRTDDTYAWL